MKPDLRAMPHYLLLLLLLLLLFYPWSIINAATYDATVGFANRAELSIPVSGQIKTINVKPGQKVVAGEILVSLDKTPYEVALAKAEADVASKKTLQQEAQRDYEQAQELYDRGVLSNVELENNKNSNIRANAVLSAAQANLVQAQYNFQHAAVIAPTNGLVLRVHANLNESINSQVAVRPLVVFAEGGKYTATAKVPRKALSGLAIGKAIAVVVGGSKFRGVVSAIAFEPVSSGKDQYEVRVDFTSRKSVYRAGQTAKLDW